MKKFILSALKTDIAKSSGLIFIASLAANLIVFLVDIFISNVLSPEGFGVFRTLFYLFAFLPLIMDLGVNITLTKYISQFKKRSSEKIGYLISYFLKIKLVSYAVLVVSVIVLKDQIALLFLNDVSLSYLIFPGAILSALFFFNSFQNIVMGFQKFKIFALSQFLVSVSSAMLGYMLSFFGIFYLILGWGIGYFVGNVFALRFFFKLKLSPTKRFDARKIFKTFSLPLHAVYIINSVYYVIVPILSIFFSQEAIGYFSFAFLFYFATMLIPNAISFVVMPKVSEMQGMDKIGDAKRLLRKVFMLYTPIVVAGILFVLLASDMLFNVFFQSYLPSLSFFKIVVIMGLLFGYNVIYTYYLQGVGRIKRFAFFAILQNLIILAVSFGMLS
ncbi:MAG: oligosaccharide flippase family protein [Candidatus Aenigmatarchaeota archaeon]